MRFPSLRRVTETDRHARAALAFWAQREDCHKGGLAYAPMPSAPLLVAIDAYRPDICWSGYVDLGEWMAHTIPDLARLANGDDIFLTERSPVSLEKMIRFFESNERPLEMPVQELAYDVLHVQRSQVLPSTNVCLLSVVTPKGRVWLKKYPYPVAPAPAPMSRSFRYVPLSLSWCLGSSTISQRLIKTVRRGDIFLISKERFELLCTNKVIGRFSINEEGEIAVQVARQHDIETEEITREAAADSVAGILSDIPIRLDFILQRRMTTLAQLDALYRGQVLEFDQQAERHVEITVNGVRIAKGELVELNGCLGVELYEIFAAKLPIDRPDA